MSDVFSKKWLVGVIAGWALILGLDELTYYYWKKLNPGSMYSGILVKHPTQNWQTIGVGANNAG
jgi:hypothetical protein